MSVRFEGVSQDAIDYIASNMREQDAREVLASHDMTPAQALDYCVRVSDFISIAFFNSVPCAVFGLVRQGLLADTGAPWLLGTDAIDLCKLSFIKHTRAGVAEMLEICPNLVNYVHVGSRKSIGWLTALGFELDTAAPYGVRRELFHRFHMRKN